MARSRLVRWAALSGAAVLVLATASPAVSDFADEDSGAERRPEIQQATVDEVLAPRVEPAASQPQADRPGPLKRAVRSFLSDDESGEGHGKHLGPLFPRVEILSSGSGLAPMLHFWMPDIGATPLDVHASAAYSIHGYQYYDMQVGMVPHVDQHLPRVAWGTSAPFPLSDLEKTASVPGFNVYASARQRDYPREVFYGSGSSSVQLERADYRLQDGLYEGIVRLRVSRVSLMGRAGVLRASIRSGRDATFPNAEIGNDEASAPGLLRTSDFLHFSVGAWLEWRDEPGNPHGGASVGVAYSRVDDRGGKAYEFGRTLVDVREYFSLGSRRHVLGLRQVASFEQPDAGSRVPFYMLSALGGSAFLGGYSSGRFRDRNLFAMAGEYRFEVHPKVELALIYQTGKVFKTLQQFDLRDLRRCYGVGIRLKSFREVRLRIDVLHSAEGTHAALKLGPSF